MTTQNSTADQTTPEQPQKKLGRPSKYKEGQEFIRSSFSVPSDLGPGLDKFMGIVNSAGFSSLLIAFAQHPEEFGNAIKDLYDQHGTKPKRDNAAKRAEEKKAEQLAKTAEKLRNKFTAEELAAIAAQLSDNKDAAQ